MNESAPAWLTRFPALAAIRDPAWRQAAASAQIMRVTPGYVLFRDGSPCKAWVLVAQGSILVRKVDKEGREIVLYRVEDCQSCMLTTTCLLGGLDYPAEGVAETAAELVVLPSEIFETAMAESEGFRRFVMRAIGRRIADLMALIEEVAFGRMDARLARLLRRRAEGGELRITHQELASELGTAREVVSRVLKSFERNGWVRLGRGRIEVLDDRALAALCDNVTDNGMEAY